MTAPLRVLVVHNRYRSGQPSGEDRVVDRDVELLTAGGHAVERYERRSDDIAALPLARRAAVPLLVPWNPGVRADLRARLRASAPDVVHVHNVFPLLSASIVAACADEGVPLVATLHNYLQVCPSGTLHRNGGPCRDCVGRSPLPAVAHGCYRGSRLATVPLAIGHAVNRRRWWDGVDTFLCISDAQRRELVDAGMPAGKLVVRHNVVPEPAQRRAGPGEHVLFLGRLTAEKGVRLLMAAWDELAASGGIGLPLVLAGAGPLEAEVRAWAEGRADVRCSGLLDAGACAALTARAAAVAVPSTWLEAFGLVVVEAMAAGVPVVAAGHGAPAELVDDGVTGLLHEPGDAGSLARALRAAVADPARNAAMGKAGRWRYEAGFTPAAGLDALERCYREAVVRGRGEGDQGTAGRGSGTRSLPMPRVTDVTVRPTSQPPSRP